jgi:thioredoxin-like negative regulator of GroEL
MKMLESQDQFEELFHYDASKQSKKPDGMREKDNRFIVYFTARWCGPCRQIDTESVEKAATVATIPIWKCDIDVNDYTPGYCGVHSIPTFMCFEPKHIVSTLKSNNNDEIARWIATLN